jgi:hypothetical protein
MQNRQKGVQSGTYIEEATGTVCTMGSSLLLRYIFFRLMFYDSAGSVGTTAAKAFDNGTLSL